MYDQQNIKRITGRYRWALSSLRGEKFWKPVRN